MSPITFSSLYMERVWGGREFSTHLGRTLPGNQPIGEAWEIVDREEAQSVVSDGPQKGKTLHHLWTDHREEIFGRRHREAGPRFPLLCKLLDARDKLSLQVHPPVAVAPQLGGEPKTEMWYFLASDEGSAIYAGLEPGSTKDVFHSHLQSGKVEECLHTLPTREGDSIFIPSGRLHAIGQGNLIVEIQQNSDTTYRVFDWNRVGLDGEPRQLHLEESLLSINFEDFSPPLSHIDSGLVASCQHFQVEKIILSTPTVLTRPNDFALVTVVEGRATCGDKTLRAGDFFLLPAHRPCPVDCLSHPCALLVTTIP